MGKNFSCNNVDGKRRVADFYETPYGLTRLFLDTGVLDPSKTVLEPAAGNGAIVKVLKEYNFQNITAFDVKGGTNFLSWETPIDQLITNPPYSIAQEFILHAKKVVRERFALLLPLSYLHGKRRYDEIWQDREFPLKSVYVFTRYPHLGGVMRDDGKHETGMMVYCWMLWERSAMPDVCFSPSIHWIDNNHLVVKGGKHVSNI